MDPRRLAIAAEGPNRGRKHSKQMVFLESAEVKEKPLWWNSSVFNCIQVWYWIRANSKGDPMPSKPSSVEAPEADKMRWAVISLDGSHSWLGRSEPTGDDMDQLRELAKPHKHPLWLARVEGDYYSQKRLIVTLWAYLNSEFGGEGSFEAAVVAFGTRRNRIIAETAAGKAGGPFPEVIARRDLDKSVAPPPLAL